MRRLETFHTPIRFVMNKMVVETEIPLFRGPWELLRWESMSIYLRNSQRIWLLRCSSSDLYLAMDLNQSGLEYSDLPKLLSSLPSACQETSL